MICLFDCCTNVTFRLIVTTLLPVPTGGKYYYTQDDTAIVAFTIGTQLDVDRPYGFKIIAGHTDSPNLRVKPRSKRTSAGECVQLAVEVGSLMMLISSVLSVMRSHEENHIISDTSYLGSCEYCMW